MKIYVHAATSNTKNLTLGSILTVDELSKYITHPDDLEKFNTYVTPDLYDSLESAINDPKGALEVPPNYPIKDFRLSDGYNGDTPIWVFHRRNDDCVRIDYKLECRVGGFYYIYGDMRECIVSDYGMWRRGVRIVLNFDGSYNIRPDWPHNPDKEIHKLEQSSDGKIICHGDGIFDFKSLPHYVINRDWEGEAYCKRKDQIDEVIDEMYGGKFNQRKRKIVYDFSFN